MDNPKIDALFLNPELFLLLCESLAGPTSLDLVQTNEREGARKLAMKLKIGLTEWLHADLSAETSGTKSVSSSHRVTPLALLIKHWAGLRSIISEYWEVRHRVDNHPRFVRIDGRASWRRRPREARWNGDLVVYQRGSSHEIDLHAELSFAKPFQPDAFPTEAHGRNVCAVTLWDPYLIVPRRSTMASCDVVAIVSS